MGPVRVLMVPEHFEDGFVFLCHREAVEDKEGRYPGLALPLTMWDAMGRQSPITVTFQAGEHLDG